MQSHNMLLARLRFLSQQFVHNFMGSKAASLFNHLIIYSFIYLSGIDGGGRNYFKTTPIKYTMDGLKGFSEGGRCGPHDDFSPIKTMIVIC